MDYKIKYYFKATTVGYSEVFDVDGNALDEPARKECQPFVGLSDDLTKTQQTAMSYAEYTQRKNPDVKTCLTTVYTCVVVDDVVIHEQEAVNYMFADIGEDDNVDLAISTPNPFMLVDKCKLVWNS